MRTLRNLPLIALLLAAPLLATGCLDEGVSDSQSAVQGRPYFEVWAAGNGRYYFHLNAANHQTLIASQGYSSRTAALGGVLSVQNNGLYAEAYELRESSAGDSYYVLKAGNGKIIGVSEMYSTKSNAKNAIGAAQRNVGDYLAYWNTRSGARFDVAEGQDGRSYFTLKAANGATVLQSQGYSSEASALNGTFSVAANGVNANRYDVRKSNDGGYYFNLTATNGQVIGTSEVYSSKSNAERARDAIADLLPAVELL